MATPPTVGRLLRSVRDCQLFHLERAMDALEQRRQDEHRESPALIEEQAPAGPGGIGAADPSNKAQQRVLALADHKVIATLQSLLSAIDRTYAYASSALDESSRNLVVAVATSLMTQATRDCKASKRNCCIWGSESRKLLRLLYWIAVREARQSAADHPKAKSEPRSMFLRPLILQWLQDSTDKTRQLTACLVLFELLQLHRHAVRDGGESWTSLVGVGDANSVEMIGALVRVVGQGSVLVKNNTKKATTLGLVALETLIMVCSDVAIRLMLPQETEEASSASMEEFRVVVDGIEHAIKTLLDWHGHAPHRRFLVVALRQLHSFVHACSALAFPDKSAISGEATATTRVAALRMVLWHWQATAPLLCTRSDSMMKTRDSTGPATALESILIAMAADFGQQHIVRYDFEVARLRQLCALMDLAQGTIKTSERREVSVFVKLSVAARSALIVFVVRLLESAIKRQDTLVVGLVDNLLRSALVEHNSRGNAVKAQEEARIVVAQLFGCLLRTAGKTPVRQIKRWSDQATVRSTVERLVADVAIAQRLPILTWIPKWLDNEPTESAAIQTTLSLARTLLLQVDNSLPAEAVGKLWRSQLTPFILPYLDDHDAGCRHLATWCLPLLDPVGCVFHAVALRLSDRSALLVITFFLRNSSGQELDEVASALMDLWRFGDSAIANNKVVTATEGSINLSAAWWSQHYQIHKAVASATTGEGLSGQMSDACTRLAFDSNGWCHHVTDVKRRAAILHVVLRKILGSPRDATLFKIIRELAAADWIQGAVFLALVRPLVSHMMNQEQLREELLADESVSSSAAVEALLFARLAPVLVLRVLPREEFCRSGPLATVCEHEEEGLTHLLKYREQREDTTKGEEEECEQDDIDSTDEEHASVMKDLFHVSALQVLNPLEFKEVKMLAVEILAKLPVECVLPFVLPHLMAFARDELSRGGVTTGKLTLDDGGDAVPSITEDINQRRKAVVGTAIPQTSCGLVAAKLLVYYLNRVLVEGSLLDEDDGTWTASAVLGTLLLLLHIPCDGDGADAALLADLQLGCIDWVAQFLLPSSSMTSTDIANDDWEQFVELLTDWMGTGDASRPQEPIANRQAGLATLIQERMRQFAPLSTDGMSLQFRICCCNVLLSTLRKLDDQKGAPRYRAIVIARQALEAIAKSVESEIVAGGLELLFTFLYKFAALENEDTEDGIKRLDVAQDSFSTVLPLLETAASDKVAMSGLKVVGALIGRVPQAIAALPLSEFQRFGSCLAALRDRRLSSAVSELSSSLLAALFPSSV